MKSNLAFLAVVSVASIGISEVESVESKLRGANTTPIIAKSVHNSSGKFDPKDYTGKNKSFSLSGDWVINSWSKENHEEGAANEKVNAEERKSGGAGNEIVDAEERKSGGAGNQIIDAEERKSANVEFTGEWVIRQWSKNNNEEKLNEQVEQHAASSSVVENKKQNFPISWEKSNGEEGKERKSKVDIGSDLEIKWTRDTPIKNKFHSDKIKV